MGPFGISFGPSVAVRDAPVICSSSTGKLIPFGMTNLRGRCVAQKFEFNTLAVNDNSPLADVVTVHEGSCAAS
jgi:hypothetical protein